MEKVSEFYLKYWKSREFKPVIIFIFLFAKFITYWNSLQLWKNTG